jgi:RsiW-degrading membrane proteinase PrsW (M82 family)
VLVSGLSTVGWLATVATAALTVQAVIVGGPIFKYLRLTVFALAVGIGFAVTEKRLYRVDG